MLGKQGVEFVAKQFRDIKFRGDEVKKKNMLLIFV